VVAHLSSDSWSSEPGGDADQKALLGSPSESSTSSEDKQEQQQEKQRGQEKIEKEQKDHRNKKRQKGDQKVTTKITMIANRTSMSNKKHTKSHKEALK